jgi:hypothetical protein
MVTLLLAIHSQYTLWFAGADTLNIPVVEKYLTNRGVRVLGIKTSLSTQLLVSGDTHIITDALSNFGKEFYGRFSISRSEATISAPTDRSFTITKDPVSGSFPWKLFADDSLVVKAYREELKWQLKTGPVSFIKGTYRLIPWINEQNKRSEAISGEFIFQRGARASYHSFLYGR